MTRYEITFVHKCGLRRTLEIYAGSERLAIEMGFLKLTDGKPKIWRTHWHLTCLVAYEDGSRATGPDDLQGLDVQPALGE